MIFPGRQTGPRLLGSLEGPVLSSCLLFFQPRINIHTVGSVRGVCWTCLIGWQQIHWLKARPTSEYALLLVLIGSIAAAP